MLALSIMAAAGCAATTDSATPQATTSVSGRTSHAAEGSPSPSLYTIPGSTATAKAPGLDRLTTADKTAQDEVVRSAGLQVEAMGSDISTVEVRNEAHPSETP